MVAGPEGSDAPERFVPMINAERSPTFFQFDPAEQLRLYKEMDADDEETVVVYHSHTATEAYPSRTDIGLAAEPQAHYVLVSTAEHGDERRAGGGAVVPDRRRRGDRGGDRDHGIASAPTDGCSTPRSMPSETEELDGSRGPDPHDPAHLHRR